MEDRTLYGYTRDEHEYTVIVPKMYAEPSPHEPVIVIAISAHGGGTPGESYAHNGWDYAVYSNGTEVINGDDLSSGSPATHARMAVTLATFLSADAEAIASPRESGERSQYDAEALAFLESEGERLGNWAAEQEH